LIQVKKLFFKTFKYFIDEYSIEQQIRIYQSHNFELLYFSIKNYNFSQSLYYLKKLKVDFFLVKNNYQKLIKVLKKNFKFTQ